MNRTVALTLAVVALVLGPAIAIAASQGPTGATGPTDPGSPGAAAAAYRQTIVTYRAGAPFCPGLTTSAAIVDALVPTLTNALDLFATTTIDFPDDPSAVCELNRAAIRAGLDEAGLLAAREISERRLSDTLAVLRVDGDDVLMQRDVRDGQWRIVADPARGVVNRASRRFSEMRPGSESVARLADALASLDTEATETLRDWRRFLALRGLSSGAAPQCTGRRSTATGRALKRAELRITATRVCLKLRPRDLLPAASTGSTIVAKVRLIPARGTIVDLQVALLPGGRALVSVDDSDGRESPAPFKVLQRPERWSVSRTRDTITLSAVMPRRVAARLGGPVLWLGVLQRFTRGTKGLFASAPSFSPTADVTTRRALARLPRHPGSGS